MNKNLLIIYALCGILGPYGNSLFLSSIWRIHWLDGITNFGIHDETTEKQVEITLFIVSGLIYFGLILWLIRTRFVKKSLI